MNTETLQLTLDNFFEQTGRRFRVSNEQGRRIRNGEITREQAFQEAIQDGYLDRISQSSTVLESLPGEFWLRSDLTINTFSDISEEVTGRRRRFRVSTEQSQKIRNGEMTREQAFNETLEQQRRDLTNE